MLPGNSGARARLIAALLLTGTLLIVPVRGEDPPARSPSLPPAVGEQALTYRVPDLKGSPMDLPGLLEGKVSLIAFWATWCQPCIEEIPRLRDVARKYRDRGALVVGVGLRQGGESKEKQRAFAMAFQMDYMTVFDERKEFQTTYALNQLPYSILVGADGRIAWKGPLLPSDLEGRIEALLPSGNSEEQGG
jgi:peroxiredoxin